MTEHCSKSITPDSLTGMIFAMEGMKNTVVLLNGPMGCKFYHSTTSQFLTIHPNLYLPAAEGGEKVPVDYNYLNHWFFRQPRVPCTWLDGYDYVYGTGQQVREGLRYLKDHVKFELLVIVNSPGASLIGDNLEEIAGEILPEYPRVILESPGYSKEYQDGYETASVELLRQAAVPLWKGGGAADSGEGKQVKKVNILGLSIWQRYYEGTRAEMERLFRMCGIEVNCFLCAGSSLEELKKIPEADLNVVLYPELGTKGAKFLQEIRQMPCYISPGLPIGFSSVETMFSRICGILQTDPGPLLEECEKARALAWYKINQVYQMCGLPKGTRFFVEGMESEVEGYRRFLTEYLGMIPASEMEAELIFGDANTIASLKTRRTPFCGIEISLPGMGYLDVLEKTHMGIRGTLFLIEQVLNGLMSKL